MEREQICGVGMIAGIVLLALCVLGIRCLNVEVKDIQVMDNGVYAVTTEKATLDILAQDVLRIERTYSKAALTGELIELEKIYTSKGFIYLSSSDPFAASGKRLIAAVDPKPNGEDVWILPGTTENENYQIIKPFDYALGTPERYISIVGILLKLQVFSLFVLSVSLLILILPIKPIPKKVLKAKPYARKRELSNQNMAK
ncbi:MAG: hypothetical protein LBT22_04135 [Peptococcaceae bacterium]|nr:hypothetical protein [Peptococcaceae bacterium]